MKVINDDEIFSVEYGFAPNFVPINMYSNIINGYGIFAGYSVSSDTIYFSKK